MENGSCLRKKVAEAARLVAALKIVKQLDKAFAREQRPELDGSREHEAEGQDVLPGTRQEPQEHCAHQSAQSQQF